MLHEFRGFSDQAPTEQPAGWARIANSGTVTYYPGRAPGTFSAVGGDAAAYGFDYYVPSSPDTVVFGCALYRLNPSDGDILRVYGRDDSSAVTINTSDNASWRIRVQSNTVATFPAPSINAWHYVEVKARISADTTGRVVVRVDGKVVADFTGVTRSSGSGHVPVGRISFLSGGSSSSHVRITDVYVADTTGPAPYNDFLGDVVVLPITPTGPGAHSDWTGSDGNKVDNHLLVDERPPSTADYVTTATVGARETYTFTDIPADEQVHAVKVLAALTRSDPGYAGVKHLIRNPTGQVSVDAEKTFGLGGTEIVGSGPFTLDPAGQPWTPGTVNAAEYGVEAT